VLAARSLTESNEEATGFSLVAALADPEPEVRREAIKALARRPFPEFEREALRLIHNDPSEAVAAEAVRSLGGVSSQPARDALRKALETPSRREVMRIAALTALSARVEWDPEVFSRVVAYAQAPNPPSLRSAALTAALKIANGRPETRNELFDLCRVALYGSGSLKLATVKGLAQLPDERAIPLLEVFLRDDPNPGPFDLSFRELARTALNRLRAVEAHRESRAEKE
jgi:HEAT repeat protein